MDDDRVHKLSKHEQLQGHHDPSYTPATSPAPASPHTNGLTLALDVRRTFIACITAAAVAVIIGLTFAFHHGFELRKYDADTLSQEDRDTLLDKYNGYSGTISSAVGRPLEMVVAMTTQLLVLRFLTSALLQREPQWHVGMIALGIGAGLGFLLNNGFTALNVQLRDLEVIPVIKASDLRTRSLQDLINATAISNLTKTYPETQAKNSIVNTILRNAILPRTEKAPVQCVSGTAGQNGFEDSVTYGFQQSEWMKYVIPEALEAKKLRFVINATDPNANKNVNSANLPMNASRAVNLFLTGVILSGRYLPWGKKGVWVEDLPRDIASTLKENETVPTAVVAGLFPNKPASELEQRDYFLRASQTFFNTRALIPSNVSHSNIEIEFAHVDISDHITFDSMTFQVEMNPNLLGYHNTTIDNVRYTEVNCGPWPGICSYSMLKDDPEVVAHAYAACANDDGTETFQSRPKTDARMNDFVIQCPRKSNSSLILISTARRAVADAILPYPTTNRNPLAFYYPYAAKNLRKFYSMTVSRLAWTSEDLATTFGATCDSPGGCQGLHFETSNNKSLVVGIDSLPLTSLNTIDYNFETSGYDPLPFYVLDVTNPTMKDEYDHRYGEYILPHNIADTKQMNLTRQAGTNCSALDENRQQVVFNNHVYMESTLQTTYTAGVFLLFQNGVLKDKIERQDQALTLAFDGNKQQLSLWISIPTTNALLTAAGCVLLVLGCVAAMMWSSRRANDAIDTMQSITTPHVIARVILDDNAFPSSVVRRRVVWDPENHISPDNAKDLQVNEFYIHSIALQRTSEPQDTTVQSV